jgi:hypothetical protein
VTWWQTVEEFDASTVCIVWKHESLAVGLWRWSLFLVLTLCIAEFVWKCSSLFTTKFINVNMYSHGRGKISNLTNRFLHEFLDLTPAIILTVLFCKVNIILLLGELPQKNYSIFHYGMEIGKINWFQGVSAADMRHWSNCITWSA